MNINYNEKLNKIKSDRIIILEKIKENIKNNNIELSKNINIETLESLLEHDKEYSKKYNSILKAKQLIFDLTEEITRTNDIEEIINLRKKINYYINKIKKELEKRENNNEQLEKIYEKVSYLRNDISQCLRFLKRENNIFEIDYFIQNNDFSNKEKVEKLKKLVSNEIKYNKRNLQNLADKTYPNVKKKKIIENKKIDNEQNVEKIEQKTEPIIVNIQHDLSNNLQKTDNSEETIDENYIDKRINLYDQQYKPAQLFDYNTVFFKRIINCFRNIPRYSWNQKMIKKAENDYNIYYHGQDLNGYIKYLKRKNSIITALLAIFKSSYLSKKELEYLYNSEKCKEWIIEFFYNQENKNLVRVNKNS